MQTYSPLSNLALKVLLFDNAVGFVFNLLFGLADLLFENFGLDVVGILDLVLNSIQFSLDLVQFSSLGLWIITYIMNKHIHPS